MLELQWLGHSSWLIRSDKLTVAVDPFLTDNPKRACLESEVHADVILVSHGHFDHVQDVAAIANRCGSLVVANYEIATWFSEKHGVKKTQGMNLGGWFASGDLRVKMTIAHHSSQLPDGSYGGNPGGYVIEIADHRLYYAGDTALFSDMSLIGRLGIDVAILPIGDLFTMGIEDAVEATALLNPKHVLPTHFDTWPPIERDTSEWSDKTLRSTSAIPIVLKPGEKHRFN